MIAALGFNVLGGIFVGALTVVQRRIDHLTGALDLCVALEPEVTRLSSRMTPAKKRPTQGRPSL
jgi:hypothetical protein